MINANIYDYTKEQLINYLRHEAGSSNPDYFRAIKPGGMKLQQVPEEYSSLLLLLKESEIETYLEMGIGNGGSFAMACYFMKRSLKHADAVDNLDYGALIGQNANEVMQYIDSTKSMIGDSCEINFHCMTTDGFFSSGKPIRYDAVFIDADHTYEAAKRDYINTLKHVKDGSLIVFHDINSQACPGIVRLWNEVKTRGTKNYEFIHSDTCGIGVVQI